jgi:hypothetical protein
MRVTSLALTTIAALALGSIAHAADTGSFRVAQAAEKQGTTQTEGSKKEQLQGQGGSSMNKPAGSTGTTGTGVGGGNRGSSMQPGGTNNEQSGTQSHDAQKGGTGKDGAR